MFGKLFHAEDLQAPPFSHPELFAKTVSVFLLDTSDEDPCTNVPGATCNMSAAWFTQTLGDLPCSSHSPSQKERNAQQKILLIVPVSEWPSAKSSDLCSHTGT